MLETNIFTCVPQNGQLIRGTGTARARRAERTELPVDIVADGDRGTGPASVEWGRRARDVGDLREPELGIWGIRETRD